MPQMAIIVEFETLPGREEAFLEVIGEHARATLAEEPGCLRFEVIRGVERSGNPIPGRVLVNELYADAAAVAAHEANPRMPSVGAAVKALVASQRLILAEVL